MITVRVHKIVATECGELLAVEVIGGDGWMRHIWRKTAFAHKSVNDEFEIEKSALVYSKGVE